MNHQSQADQAVDLLGQDASTTHAVDIVSQADATIHSSLAQLSLADSAETAPSDVNNAFDPSAQVKDSARSSQSLPLDKLPLDVILKIGSFLPPKDIVCGLMETCKLMKTIFSSDEYWRVRIKSQWRNQDYPILADQPPVNSMLWRKRCHYRELQYYNFRDAANRMTNRVIGADQGALHYGDINAMAFGPDGEYLATAGRDRQVILWDLKELKKDPASPANNAVAKAQSLLFSHGGWVWSLQTMDNLLSSGAWDGVINIADLNHPIKRKSQTLKCTHAVTCHSWQENRLVAGTILGSVAVFDPREGNSQIFRKDQDQSEAILGMHVVDNKVIIVGSERKIQVLDLRKRDFIVKRAIPDNDFGTKIHVNEGHAWVGTKHGKVLLYDLCNFDVVEDFTASCGHTDHITGIHYDSGHILTCGLDRKARMVEPVRNPGLVWEYATEYGYTSMDYSKNCMLGLAWGPVFGVWWPKE